MEFNIAQVLAAVAGAHPDRVALVNKGVETSFADFAERSARFAGFLAGRGLGCRSERAGLAGHESGQDHVALYLHNCNEYLEGMIGAWGARTASFNVNHRYVAEELHYLFTDARTRAIVYHAAFAPTLAEVLDDIDTVDTLIHVDDGSGVAPLPGAIDYEDALASAAPRPFDDCSPDDLYILYTGGTTGMPKGVLWRQADFFVAALGGTNRREGTEHTDMDGVLSMVGRRSVRWMTAAPFMHGAAQWIALQALTGGHTVVMPDVPEHFDAPSVLTACDRDGVEFLQIVGDAFARPLLDAVQAGAPVPGQLTNIISGGAVLHAELKAALKEHMGDITIRDSIGSSETGVQGSNVSAAGQSVSTGDFVPAKGSTVVSADMDVVLDPGHHGIGWFAMSGRVPLGYLGDAEKTARTFPVVEGVRMSVPGDRARMLDDGRIEVLGRDSVTINSGGEKIFAEEVEVAVKSHPAVYDAVVCGRPSERWGSEVVAIVQLVQGHDPDDEQIITACEDHLARYKWPKAIVRVDTVVRSPAGKPDYRWAAQVAAESLQ